MTTFYKTAAITLVALSMSVSTSMAAQPEKLEAKAKDKIVTEAEDKSETKDAVKVKPGKETIELDETQKADQEPTKHMEEVVTEEANKDEGKDKKADNSSY